MFFFLTEESTDDFVDYLRSSGIVNRIIRSVYGYFVSELQRKVASNGEGERDFALPFFQVGFTDLDDAAVHEFEGIDPIKNDDYATDAQYSFLKTSICRLRAGDQCTGMASGHVYCFHS
jgi:hypothetical protein